MDTRILLITFSSSPLDLLVLKWFAQFSLAGKFCEMNKFPNELLGMVETEN